MAKKEELTAEPNPAPQFTPPRKSFAVISDDLRGKSLDAMAGLHPAGTFQCILSEIFGYLGEYKDTKTKQIAQDFFYIFAFTTIERGTGTRRTMLTKQMTGKPHSANSTMGKLLRPWFNNAKPDEMKALVPHLEDLLDRNGLMKIDHEPNSLNTGIFATIASISEIQTGPDGKPVYPVEYTDETYVPILHRFPDDYQRIDDPTAPGTGKQIWFRAYRERDDAVAATPAQAGSNGGSRPSAKPSY